MRVSLNWLKEYVTFDMDPQILAEKLTMSGIAVEAIEYPGKEIKGIYVGEVIEVIPHPNADKLSLCKVNVNEANQNLPIICGAPNVKKGQRVVVALPGATLPGDVKIKKAKIRGIESFGMICSGQELGMEEDLIPEEQRHGIIVLNDDAPLGADAKQLLGLEDVIFVLELTPNRSDCLSIVNVAKEIAALAGVKSRFPQFSLDEYLIDGDHQISVEINDTDLCERYVARVVSGIEIKDSPLWMQKRLQAAGMRPINNVVDVTNYVMLEMGQPLHAFDYDLLEGKKIIVRRAQENEEIITLDKKERQLNSEQLVIADTKRAIAIAGVMGGYNTEVENNTTTVIIESAYFNPTSVRKTSLELNLRSEASLRFEKGIDKNRVNLAADRAAYLLALLAGGKIEKGYVDNYPVKYNPIAIELRCRIVNSTIGLNLTADEIKKLLESIELTVEHKAGEVMTVFIPSHRLDLTKEIDLIEEIARLHGYNKIPNTLPRGSNNNVSRTKEQLVEKNVRAIMVASGFSEVITYSFLNVNHFDKLSIPKENTLREVVRIANPLSEDGAVMRTTMIPGLMDVMIKNINRKITSISIYELGKTYHPGEGVLPKEINRLALLVTGSQRKGWAWQNVDMDFYFAKGLLEELALRMGISFRFCPTTDNSTFHPGRQTQILLNNAVIGVLGELSPQILENYGVQQAACIAELDLDKVAGGYSPIISYQEIPRYPSIQRDLAILVKEEVNASQIEKIIDDKGKPLLNYYYLFDLYKGKQVPEGYKSLAFSLIYQSKDRTLTDEEVNDVHRIIQEGLITEIGARLR
ncbi:MAG: phenylalanine--tRNA ligase subunit beta [Bacillota bacterium]